MREHEFLDLEDFLTLAIISRAFAKKIRYDLVSRGKSQDPKHASTTSIVPAKSLTSKLSKPEALVNRMKRTASLSALTIRLTGVGQQV